MAESHVISALVKKRSELLGNIEYYEQIIKESEENLHTIDKAILIFDDSYNLSSVKPINKHRNKFFKTGEAKVLILDTLRELGVPTKTDDLSKLIANKKEIILRTAEQERSFNKSLINVLGTLERNDLVERIGKEGLTIIWKIKGEC